MRYKLFIAIYSFGLCLVTTNPAKADGSAKKIRVGSSPVLSSSAIFIAKEKGYFAELGLDAEITIFKSSGANMTVLLSTGELDVGGGNLSTGLWNAINEGVGIKLVADKGHIEEGHSYLGLLVRKDLVENGRYKSYADLKSFKMGVTSLDGVSQQIATERFLRLGGLSISNVEFIKMSYSEMNAGLAGKALDATIQIEPYLTKAVLEGTAIKVAEVHDVYPDQQSAAIFYSPHFMQKKPNAAEKFMVAYLKGIRDYEEAFVTGKNRSEIIAMLKKYINIESDEVWNNMVPAGLNPDGYLNLESLRNDLEWSKQNGFLEKVPDLNATVDHSYVEKALSVLGKYKSE